MIKFGTMSLNVSNTTATEFAQNFSRETFYRSASPATRRTHKKSDGRAASQVGARDRYGTLYVVHSTDTGK